MASFAARALMGLPADRPDPTAPTQLDQSQIEQLREEREAHLRTLRARLLLQVRPAIAWLDDELSDLDTTVAEIVEAVVDYDRAFGEIGL